MQNLLFSLFILMAFQTVSAQTVIKGIVSDVKSTPVGGAIVRAYADKTMLAYTLTDEKGQYRLTVSSQTKSIVVSAELMGFDTASRTVSNKPQNCDLTIKEKAVSLKEVIVKAPPIFQRGDTLTFNLASYISKGDYTLKDALKKLPGLDVDNSGKIKYLGKDISNFYIEGLDLLGGRYNIATNNIPAEYVKQVQVLNNHQPVKMNKNVFSDDVAINVKLDNKAKFRPVGNTEGSAGYGSAPLYRLSGAGMMFKRKFQTILTAKLGNTSRFAGNESANLFAGDSPTPAAGKVLNGIAASAPPIEPDRYARPADRMFSVNTINKLTDDATLKINTGYSFTKSTYAYSLTRNYFDDRRGLTIAQDFRPAETEHKPTLSLEYKDNAATYHLRENLKADAGFMRSRLPVTENGIPSSQRLKSDTWNLSNNFIMSWKRGDLSWQLSSAVSYSDTPEASIIVNDNSSLTSQSVNGRSFETKNRLTAFYATQRTRLSFPLLINYNADRLNTTLNRPDEQSAVNNVSFGNTALTFAPQYEYALPSLVLRADMALRLNLIASNNRTLNTKTTDTYLTAGPQLYMNYKMSARTTLRMQADYTRTFGDVLDFLTSPIQTDVSTRRVSSGVLSENKSFSAIFHADYKIPIEMWFINTDIYYNHDRYNQIATTNVSNNMVTTSNLQLPNSTDGLNAELGIAKQVQAIKTKFALKGSFTWQKQHFMQNGMLISTRGSSIALRPSIYSQPVNFLELDYKGEFSRTASRFLSVSKSYRSQYHKLALKLMPATAWVIKITTDITRRDISDNATKTMALLDAGVSFRLKSVRLSLDLTNLLNQKTYSYTIYNTVNTYNYSYKLRGRELLFTLSFIK